MEPKNLLQKLIQHEGLSEQEAFGIAADMLKGSLSQAQIAGFIVALVSKGESVEELTGFIKAMHQHMIQVPGAADAIDVCGTGGDGSGTFNISTAVALVVAGAGVKVAKHGNRAATSMCGSADVLEALGVNINLNPRQASEILQKADMVFLFAPIFHPAFKNVAAVRKEHGIKTIFNYIGPFANPAMVKRQLIGVPNVKLAEKLAAVARQLDYEHLLIVTSEDGLDEISLFGITTAFEVKQDSVKKLVINPEEYEFTRVKGIRESVKRSHPNSLQGGTAQENAQIIRNILSGEEGSKREIVVLNSAYALYIAGKVNDPLEGIILAEKSIDSGAAMEVLERLRKETIKYKEKV